MEGLDLRLLFRLVTLEGRMVRTAAVTTLVVETTSGSSTATGEVEVDADTFREVRLSITGRSASCTIGNKSGCGSSYRVRLEVLVRTARQLVPVVHVEVFFSG